MTDFEIENLIYSDKKNHSYNLPIKLMVKVKERAERYGVTIASEIETALVEHLKGK
jgi:hypothetical protein